MIDSIVIKESYFGDGSTTQFPFSFPFIDASDINVTIHDIDTGEETTLTSDYYVDTINSKVLYPGYPPGEAPPLSEQPGPLPVGQKLIVYRSTPISQLKDLGDKYPLPIIEEMVDKVTLILQELSEKLSRAVIVEIGSDTTPDQLLQSIADSVVKAKAWAEGTDADVTALGGTHSSKGWSDVSKGYAEDAEDSKDDAATWAEGNDTDVSALGGTHSAEGWAQESAGHESNAQKWAEGTDAQVVALGGTHSAKVWAQTAAKVYYVDTMAAMRADSSLTPGMVVMTKGYYTPNDGGAGTYNIRAAEAGDVDDGGSIIVLDNGHVAELITDGAVNVRQFGAKGDGTTDDAVAIQAALNAERVIVFDQASYYIGSMITVQPDQIIYGNNATLQINGNYTAVRLARDCFVCDLNVNQQSASREGTGFLVDADSGNIQCVQTQNLEVIGCEIALKLVSTVSYGICYSKFHARRLFNCKYFYYFELDNDGWINANYYETQQALNDSVIANGALCKIENHGLEMNTNVFISSVYEKIAEIIEIDETGSQYATLGLSFDAYMENVNFTNVNSTGSEIFVHNRRNDHAVTRRANSGSRYYTVVAAGDSAKEGGGWSIVRTHTTDDGNIPAFDFKTNASPNRYSIGDKYSFYYNIGASGKEDKWVFGKGQTGGTITVNLGDFKNKNTYAEIRVICNAPGSDNTIYFYYGIVGTHQWDATYTLSPITSSNNLTVAASDDGTNLILTITAPANRWYLYHITLTGVLSDDITVS